jgi:lambda family phage portal protein
MSILSNIKSFFSPRTTKRSTRVEVRSRLSEAAQSQNAQLDLSSFLYGSTFSGEKYGPTNYSLITDFDHEALLRNSRGAYFDSDIARAIVKRQKDSVINTGLTWESTPMWDLLTDAPEDPEDRTSWTHKVEHLFTLYSNTTEADIEGMLTLNQLQRKAFGLRWIDGQVIAILRYLNSPHRMSPVAVQLIRPEQVCNPTDSNQIRAIENRGGKVNDGIERDSQSKVVAMHILNDDGKTVRIPFFGPKSKRRFLIHYGNFEMVGQNRSLPELSTTVHEIKKLKDYDVAEIEAVVNSAAFLGFIETEKGSTRGNGVKLNKSESNETTTPSGMRKLSHGDTSIFLDNLEPGQTLKGYAPTRPNPNFALFVEEVVSRLSAAFGIPISVLRQKFQGSYSAARAEILFYWNAIQVERADFASSFIGLIHEAWFAEAVKSKAIEAPGFNESAIARHAWLWGTWNGIARPVVDPVKEVNAVKIRTELGHTTGSKESKAYNGSDFDENVERQKQENEKLSESRKSLNSVEVDQTEETEMKPTLEVVND